MKKLRTGSAIRGWSTVALLVLFAPSCGDSGKSRVGGLGGSTAQPLPETGGSGGTWDTSATGGGSGGAGGAPTAGVGGSAVDARRDNLEGGATAVDVPSIVTDARDASVAAPTDSDTANCGWQTWKPARQPTDILLLLDRSNSMVDSIAADCTCTAADSRSRGIPMCSDASTCTQRWPTLTTAIDTIIANSAGIAWGLKLFPSAGDSFSACAVSSGVEVPVGPTETTAAAIQSAIAATVPGGSTPTAQAVRAATAYLKAVNDQKDRVILLATDGQPNCAGGRSNASDVEGTRAAIQGALAEGFKTYVIGIGPNVGNLDELAKAGGTDHYHPATSAADLAGALNAITKTVVGCTFVTSYPPPARDDVTVYLDGMPLLRDSANGWSFGASDQQVVLKGGACDLVSGGSAVSVQVVFGCPGRASP